MLTHKGTVRLTTERLILSQLSAKDNEDMYAWACEPIVSKYLSWSPHESADETKELLSKWAEEYVSHEYYHWGLEYNGAVIGTMSLHGIHTLHERCELGYSMGAKWWNKGLTTEAVRAVIDFAFRELNANKLVALYDVQNIGSGRVLEKCGMSREGLCREYYVRKDGTRGDMVYMSVLKSEWNP